jgi:hypothetical protein
MREPKAGLYLRFREPDGKQSPYYPALYDAKRRLRPFWAYESRDRSKADRVVSNIARRESKVRSSMRLVLRFLSGHSSRLEWAARAGSHCRKNAEKQGSKNAPPFCHWIEK